MPRALGEDRLRPFLSRRRRGEGVVKLPPVGGILADALALTARLVPVRSADLWLDDPSRRTEAGAPLTCVASTVGTRVGEERVPTKDAASLAYSDGKTVRRTDGTSGRARLAVPIRLEQAVCGVLELERRQRGPFSPKERDLAELIAHYVARAILNAVDILKQNRLALTDELTGLPSVRGLDNALHAAIDRAKAKRGDLAVFFVDVDRLKHVNDVAGHRAGSEALRRVGEAMRQVLEGRGEAFRFGGDEFVVVLPDAGPAEALGVANAMRDAVRSGTAGSFGDSEALPPISVSVGIACLRATVGARAATESLATKLVGTADCALYRAKERRDIAVLATPDDVPQNVPKKGLKEP